jgi:type I restriction enzyme M protein
MAIKKSDLYSSLWAPCHELRGGMDASQYKDYVLFMLFIKYITDKYGDSSDFAAPVTIPTGASFMDMLDLRGKSDIGDTINTQVIAPLVDANAGLARSDFPDFNDTNKLGEGQAKVDRLTNLNNIFAGPQLDFSQKRAERGDILDDAYEYLMRHFASNLSAAGISRASSVCRPVSSAAQASPRASWCSTRGTLPAAKACS